MDTKRMYKAENIDTDKALKAIDKSKSNAGKSLILDREKERSYMEGLNKGLDIAEDLFKCTDYEKTEQKQLIQMVSVMHSMNLEKELDIPTQDIRDNISSVDEA